MTRSLRLIALLLMVSLIFCGCQTPDSPEVKDPATSNLPVAQPNDGIIDVDQEKLPYSEEQLYQQLFDPNNKIEACVCNFVMKDYTDENGQLHNELWIWPREGYTFSKGYGQVDMNDVVASFNRGLTQYANIKKYVKPNINAETNKVYE